MSVLPELHQSGGFCRHPLVSTRSILYLSKHIAFDYYPIHPFSWMSWLFVIEECTICNLHHAIGPVKSVLIPKAIDRPIRNNLPSTDVNVEVCYGPKDIKRRLYGLRRAHVVNDACLSIEISSNLTKALVTLEKDACFKPSSQLTHLPKPIPF